MKQGFPSFFSSEENNPQIYAEQVKLLYDQAKFSIATNLANSVLLIFVLWNVVTHSVLIAWFSALFSVMLIRFGLMVKYQSTPMRIEETNRWHNLFLVGVFATGILWGSAGGFLFPEESFIHQVFIAFVLGGMCAGSITTLSPSNKAYPLFLFPAILPIAFNFLRYKEEMPLVMGGMILLFLAILVTIAARIHVMTLHSFQLRFANSELIADLTKAKTEAELLNIELNAEIKKHRQTEQALKENKEKISSTLSSLNDLVFVLDKNGKFIDYYEPETPEISYTSTTNFIGRSFREVLPPSVAALMEEAFNAVIDTGDVRQFDYPLTINEKKYWFNAKVSTRKSGDGRFAGVIGIVRNVTERKESEHLLQEKVNQLEQFNRLAVGRELKMIELKKEINALLRELQRKDKYTVIGR